MKKTLLSIEAFVVLVPLGLFILYMTGLQIIFGIPAHIINSSNDFEPELALAFLGNLVGIFAYFILLELVYKTITCKALHFGKRFNTGLFCGSVASAILFVVYDFWLAFYVVFPTTVLVIHFIYLQVKCTNMPNK